MYRSRLFDMFPFYEGTTNNTEIKIDREANEYHLAVLLTGLTRDEVTVSVEDDTIIIEGKTERKLPTFAVRNYKNSFYAENIDTDSVKSKLENGILTITFKQKSQPVTRRNILIG
jgi:HSP20 family molecular chaperone IbpA